MKQGAHLREAELQGADLQEAHLQGARLSEIEARVEQFFRDTDIGMLSVTADDFSASIRHAIATQQA